MRTIKGELWIEYLDGRTRTHCEGKIRKLRTITFYIKINHMGKIRNKSIAIYMSKNMEIKNDIVLSFLKKSFMKNK